MTLDLFDYFKNAQEPPKKKGGKIVPAELNSCQSAALKVLKGPENVFLTGVAGSGKSFLTRQYLKDKDRKEHPVLASTGAAAILIGGRTFHSYFGLGIMQGGPEATIERALKNTRVTKRLKKTKEVIIDEISMISGRTLSIAETIAREARESELPWGGLRIIAVGDFAQLPPVTPYNDGVRDWAFADPSWSKSSLVNSLLKTTVRTKDEDFLSVLNRVREGKVDPEVAEYLNNHCIAGDEAAEFEGTRLFPLRDTVERFNLERLEEVSGKLHEFETEYSGDQRFIEDLKKSAPIPEVLRLKEGALIMMRQNDPLLRWVNGSLGQIESINEAGKSIRVSFIEGGHEVEIEPMNFGILNAEGTEVATALNFPINLAYATTIHKAQGMTLDRVLVDLRNLWEPGQAYVAMSRVKTGKGLNLLGWSPSSIKIDPRVAAFYRALSS